MSNFRKMCRALYTRSRQRKSGYRKSEWNREKLIYPFRMLLHPLSTLSDIKYEHKGSLRLANVLIVLFFAVNLLEEMQSGYLFSPPGEQKINVLLTAARTVGVVIVWTICNWATCTLTDGEGSMSEIWIMLAYSLLPWILLDGLSVAVSHMLSSDEAVLYQALKFVYIFWTLLLAFLSMLTAHQYTVKKTILSSIVTLLVIFAACFLMLVFFSIGQQMVGFVSGLIQEVTFR